MDVHLVDEHGTFVGVVEPRQQLGDGAFSGSTGSDKGNNLASGDLEIDVVQHFRPLFCFRPVLVLGRVGEADVVELQRAGESRGGDGVRWPRGTSSNTRASTPAIRRCRGP